MIDLNEIDQRKEIKNASLYFDKYLGIIKRNSEPKKISEPEQIIRICKICSRCDRELLSSLVERRKKLTEKIGKSKHVFDETLTLDHRLLVGSGSPSILEVGFTFSRNYGIPIIPGTAIKGAFSHYIQEELPEEHLLRKKEIFKKLFGTDENGNNHAKGALMFLDAIPEKYRIGVDIVNNHFQPYYMKEDKPPNDWYNPNPVTYLVVEEGSRFRFTILLTEHIEDDLKSEVKKELLNFLQNYGVGAKTSYGYGLFEKPTD